MLKVLDIAGIHPDMRTSASVETCSLSMRQCQQTAIARMHCINSGHTNISVEICLSLWNKFGLYYMVVNITNEEFVGVTLAKIITNTSGATWYLNL